MTYFKLHLSQQMKYKTAISKNMLQTEQNHASCENFYVNQFDLI